MYSASASCCALTSSSVSGRGIGAFAAFSAYVAPTAAGSAAHAAPLPSRNAAVPSAIDFFHVVICHSPL